MAELRAGLGTSTADDTASGAREALDAALRYLGDAKPRVALVAATAQSDLGAVVRGVRERLPEVAVHAGTTSLGVLTAGGVIAGAKGALGVLLLGGEGLGASVGTSALGHDARGAGRAAALEAKKGLGETSAKVLWVCASPGSEEDVLAGIGEVFPGVPLYGGSAADDAIVGEWRVWCGDRAETSGVSLVALGGDVRVAGAIAAPYEPTERRAVAHGEGDRVLRGLGDERAGSVLASWVGPPVETQAREGGAVLVQTALSPLGVARAAEKGTFWSLLHPAHVHSDGRVELFARVREGDEVCLMKGDEGSLLGSVEGLATRLTVGDGERIDAGDVRAALLIYCAGCAGAVGAGLDKALAGLREKIPGVPVLGYCTFGEQGHVPGVGNVHTNLSVSLLLLG